MVEDAGIASTGAVSAGNQLPFKMNTKNIESQTSYCKNPIAVFLIPFIPKVRFFESTMARR